MSDQQDFPANVGRLSDEDRQVERLLASMVPREARVNRDRMMYLAGQAAASQTTPSSRLKRCIWPVATACSACVGLIAGLLYGHVAAIPAPLVAEIPRGEHSSATAQVPLVPAAAITSEPNEPFSLISLQSRWLTAEKDDPSRSADALGNVATVPHSSTSFTNPELLRRLLTERS
jgi:hypothetical protein